MIPDVLSLTQKDITITVDSLDQLDSEEKRRGVQDVWDSMQSCIIRVNDDFQKGRHVNFSKMEHFFGNSTNQLYADKNYNDLYVDDKTVWETYLLTYQSQDPTSKANKARDALTPHQDDVYFELGLMSETIILIPETCAMHGGNNRALPVEALAVHLAKHHPDYLLALMAQDAVTLSSGDLQHQVTRPVFWVTDNNRFAMTYKEGKIIEYGSALAEEAIEKVVQPFLENPRNRLDVLVSPGEIFAASNFGAGHGRGHYIDDENDPSKNRKYHSIGFTGQGALGLTNGHLIRSPHLREIINLHNAGLRVPDKDTLNSVYTQWATDGATTCRV